MTAPGWARQLSGIDPKSVASRAALAKLPLLHKSDIANLQKDAPPFGGLNVTAPGKARRVVELIHDGLRAIEKLTKAAEALLKVLRYVNAGLGGANSVITAISTAQHADAGNRTDNSAEQGF
jgi:hypothetical protein